MTGPALPESAVRADCVLLVLAIPAGERTLPFLEEIGERFGFRSAFYGKGRRPVVNRVAGGVALGSAYETDEIHVVLPRDGLEAFLAYAWTRLEMDRPGGGHVLQVPLSRASLIAVPEATPGTEAVEASA